MGRTGSSPDLRRCVKRDYCFPVFFAAREHNQLVEWPAWGKRDTTVVFSLAQMSGDLFLLHESRR